VDLVNALARRLHLGSIALRRRHVSKAALALTASLVAVVPGIRLPAHPSLAEAIRLTAESTVPVVRPFPDSTTSGIPSGIQLVAKGSMTVTTPGTTLDSVDIAGTLTIAANNVVVIRSRVRGSGFDVVRILPGVTGTVMVDSEIDGLGFAGSEGSNGIRGAGQFARLDIRGVENGIVPESGSVISNSYIHDLAAPGSPHYDGIQIDGGLSDITIRHNTIEAPPNQTSAVMIDNYFGPISDITVDQNLLSGGGYALYVDAHFNDAPIDGVTVTKNRFGRSQWGYTAITSAVVSALGNFDAVTSRAIPLS
jgi:hypothetical protein